jgi:D-arabinose 1-dehydrogenase-like Zn-dependent alcohol dehydrogenase
MEIFITYFLRYTMQVERMVKAAVVKEFKASSLEIMEFPLPEVEPNDVLLKVKLAAICGSDVHKFKGEWFWPTPIIPGHEATGEVYQLGSNVKTDWCGKPIAEGDMVVYSSYYHCGKCFYCVKGEPTMCVNREELGGTITCDKPPHLNGAYAEYIYLKHHFPIFKAPENLSPEVLAPLNCACSTVMHGIQKIGLKPADSVVVLGTGGLGFYAIAIAKALNASKVIVTDMIDQRLKLAEEFGADYTINIKEYEKPEDLINKILGLSNHGFGADLVIDVTGHSSSLIPQGIRMLRKGGRYLEIGGDANMHSSSPIIASSFVPDSKVIMGVRNFSPIHLLQSLNFTQAHTDDFPFEKIISHKFKLEEINEAFRVASSREAIRVGITP